MKLKGWSASATSSPYSFLSQGLPKIKIEAAIAKHGVKERQKELLLKTLLSFSSTISGTSWYIS